MRQLLWLTLVAALAGVAYLCWRAYRNWEARRRAAEERFTSFMSNHLPAAPAAAVPPAAPEKLLFEAAAKAADAGEPALAIQLYARLLARYPESGFAAQARAEVEAQKRRLAKA